MPNTSYRPLSLVQKLIADTEFEMSYTYDDLVFIEHSHFLLRFSEKSEDTLKFYINAEEEEEKGAMMRTELEALAERKEIKLEYAGKFAMNLVEGKDEIRLEFINSDHI